MTLPAFSAAGTGSETAPAWPTHASGDLGILLVETPSGTVATPAGWTLLKVSAAASIPTSITAFYRFATSNAESAPSISGGTDHLWGVILTFTGVNASTPFHGVVIQPQKLATAHTIPGSTTLVDDCLIVHAVGCGADDAGPIASGETNADLGSLTKRYDAGTVTGNGGVIVVITGTKASRGVFVSTTITTTSTGIASLTLILQAADKTLAVLANRSRIANTGM